jgi:hypothetical protein
MGPGIIIPLVLIAIVVPLAFVSAKKYLKDGAASGVDEPVVAPSARLTSNALRELPTPTWRVVYEIAEEKLGGPGHVLIGPAGIFAVNTSMEPLPARADGPPDARAVAAAAIARAGLDDALRRCAMTSDQLLTVHWGPPADGAPTAVDTVPGAIAIDGRSLVQWAERAAADIAADGSREPLSPSRVDLAWQTVTTAIGRPDPLA